MKAQAQGHMERLEELDEGHPLREKPDSDNAENAEKREYSQAERRRLARENRALPNGSYPIVDEEDLRHAAVLARSGHGDVEAARQLIARRAKELGVKNPLDESKSIGNPYFSPLMQHLRARGLAIGHTDLQQHDANQVDGHAALRTAKPADPSREITWTPGTANVELRDFRGQAGATGPLQPNDYPVRPGYHQAPIGENNGSHSSDSQAAACSVPRQSMKATRIDIIKQAMRDQGLI